MEIRTVEDIRRIHEEFAKKLQRRIEAFREGKVRGLEVVVKEKEDDLARLEERCKRLRTAKEQVIRRYDEEIRRCEEAISRLEKEVEEGRKALERAAAEPGPDAGPDTHPSATPVVDVNTAPRAELAALPGIGPALARAIEENRPYSTLEELSLKVSGIGARKLDMLRGRLTVSGS